MKKKLFPLLLASLCATSLLALSCRPDDSSNKEVTTSSSKQSPATHKQAKSPQASTSTAPSLNIVYINIDSITSNYSFNKDVKAILESKQSQGEAAMKSKQQSFQSQMSALQQKYQNLQKRGQSATTQAEMEALNNEAKALQQQEANLAQLQDRYQNEMTKLETEYQDLVLKYTQEINDTIENFLKLYSEENGIDFILGKGGTGGVLYGNSSYDITEEIIGLLNERYKLYKK